MNNQRAEKSGTEREFDLGEVPDKQLHRWKGEGGALPPEPESDDASDAEPPSSSS